MTYNSYGNSWGADALYNLRIGYYGIECSFRFIVKDTIPVNKLRYFNAYSFEKAGYHLGNGGKIKVELQESDSNGMPSGIALGYALIVNPLATDKQPLISFDKTITLKANKIYHLVFTNYDTDSMNNYVSVNTMAIMTPKNTEKYQPELDNNDMSVLWRNKDNRSWSRFKPNQTITPIFTLYYNNVVTVEGYGGMESWIASIKKIVGDNKVREVFVADRTTTIYNVAIRLAKSGNPGQLIVRMENDRNRVLEQVKINSADVSDVNTTSGYRLGHEWVRVTFKHPIKIYKGNTYRLSLQTNNGIDCYEVFPIRDGAEFGYSPIWKNAWAEYTAIGNIGWRGWDAWGKTNLKNSHLQLYFNYN